MPNKLKYDWNAIQKYYDNGHSIRDCQEKFGFSNTARTKAVKAGRFMPRSHAEACSLLRTREFDRESKSQFSHTTMAGEVACAKFDCRALEKYAIVSRPNLECSYDRIVDWNKKLWRVQVKYSGRDDGDKVFADITKTNRSREHRVSYSENEIDVIIVYSNATDKLYWLPKDVWKGKTSVTLRHAATKNGQQKSILMAKDFEW